MPSGGICEEGRRERIRTNAALSSGAPGLTKEVVPDSAAGTSHFVVLVSRAVIVSSTRAADGYAGINRGNLTVATGLCSLWQWPQFAVR